MLRDVVVLFVHGINTTCQDYYEPLRDLIVKKLPQDVGGHTVFRAVFWADIVRGRQQEYQHYAKQLDLLRPHSMHKLVLEGLGDAAAYQKTEQQRNSAYLDIQRRIQKALADAALPGEDGRPLIVIAHSLGCHIVSSFAWDLLKLKNHAAFHADMVTTADATIDATIDKKRDGAGGSDDPQYGPRPSEIDPRTQRYIKNLKEMTAFERLDTLAGLVTMGNNMPLFTFVFGPQHVFPISQVPKNVQCHPAFPGVALDDAVKTTARWINLYSYNDPLGYPLKPLNDAYDDEKRIEDIVTRSEWHAPRSWKEWGFMVASKRIGLREGLAKQAHVGYWHDPVVASHAAKMITSVVTSGAVPASPLTLFPDLALTA
ncbi:MAG: hypothetical protein K2Y05_06185 [Hyphomicrobiaceae bacterium]|nr:hypothetical protein [Hyphomicrobiaceae bacterium]